jgi:hypothetical protein
MTTTVPPAARRSLILVAKLLQSLVNESSFEKEEYMLCFTPWVEEHVATIRSAFLTWVVRAAEPHAHATTCAYPLLCCMYSIKEESASNTNMSPLPARRQPTAPGAVVAAS